MRLEATPPRLLLALADRLPLLQGVGCIDGTRERMHPALREGLRRLSGREPTPSAAIIDSQTAKITEKGGVRGYDGGKKIGGRKRRLLVDTEGSVIGVAVHAANIADRDGARLLLEKVGDRLPRTEKVRAGGGYNGEIGERVRSDSDGPWRSSSPREDG